MVGRSVGRSVDRSVGQSVGRSVAKLNFKDTEPAAAPLSDMRLKCRSGSKSSLQGSEGFLSTCNRRISSQDFINFFSTVENPRATDKS